MNIVFISSEVVPFAKTGGLADVCGALPIEIQKLGHHATVFMPAYSSALNTKQPIEATDVVFTVPVGKKAVGGRLLKSSLPDSEVDVYLIEHNQYFARQGIYQENGSDYEDNCERFTFFNRAVMECCRLLNLNPHVLHCNDWQTGLIPPLLNIEYQYTPGFEDTSTLLTIHNLAYQGSFWHWDMLLTGFDWKYFNWKEFEYYGRLNLLKTGIVFADGLTTVSPRYAQEIQTQEFGHGLDPVIRHRTSRLVGIMNGIDAKQWDPASDRYLDTNYDVSNWRHGKSRCKLSLQDQLGLPQRPDVPMIGLVGRLASQKGWNLVLDVMQRWLPHLDLQWVVLGTGEKQFADALSRLATKYPDKISVRLEFSNQLAHRIEAASDIFVMPSQYEPCGLNQLYSLRYGAVPVVRSTGGLADSITDANETTLRDRTANGFAFEQFDSSALDDALTRALTMLLNDNSTWSQVVETGMAQDWSWAQSARKYESVYKRLAALKISNVNTMPG
jgi:starch synthase